jgi:hypothetical protein
MTDPEFLAAAKQALQKVILGQSVRVIQKDGRRIEYTPAMIPDLERYIRSLSGGSRRPMGIC